MAKVTKPGVPSALNDLMSSIKDKNAAVGRDVNSVGVHSAWPFMTPKYARWERDRHHEFEDTMARLFIKVPPKDYQKFLKSLEDPETALIAQYLTGDNAKKGGVGYLDFFLQSVRHQFVEKMQVSEVLSDNYVSFFFGHQAPIFSYQGTLMNTFQDDWTMRMYRIFRDLGRGTQLARRGQILNIRYDSMIVSGAMTNFSWNLEAGRETYCDFSFDLLVKNVYIILGGYAPPTDVKGKGQFAPSWVTLEDGTQASASKTYLGGPPVAPAGVSPATAGGAEPTQQEGPTGEEVKAMPQAGGGVDVDEEGDGTGDTDPDTGGGDAG